jgi:hypothetical protein
MAQIFGPAANTIAKASLFALAGVPFLFVAGSMASRGSYNTKVDVPLNQPVPFSHKHHAAELDIDCRFCHTAVETSANAGLPSTEVCMTCHSQIWTNSPMLQPVRDSWATNTPLRWNQVNKVPDFVYFNHAIHVNKGINCDNCHGPIQNMEITWKGKSLAMMWCLECHENPEKFLVPTEPGQTPKQQVFALFHKYSSGQALTTEELELIMGEGQKAPKDKAHEAVAAMKERGINKSQLMDCYVCHH